MWDYLKRTTKPIVLYGTGNAAERIIDQLNAGDIKISGIFASNGFVRDRSFAGFKVMSYEDCKTQFGDMIVLVCFGSHLPEVIDNIKFIDSEQELYMPDLPVVGDGLFTEKFFAEHKEDITQLSSLLADDESRRVLSELITYRLTGRINHLLACESSDEENIKLLGLGADEIYMDLGAYTGDTVAQFLSFTSGKYSKIYAVEPEERNFRKLFENTKELQNIQLINAAVGDVPGEIMFTHGVGRGGALGKGKTRPVTQESVDHILQGNPISYIKIDVEGGELEALEGARESISKYKPKLLVAAYHRIDDYWSIPKKLLEINPDYKFYLRKSPCLPCWEVNYYCI